MTRDEAREVAKSMLPAYLAGKGIDLKHPFHCLSSAHADHHPSMSYRPKTNTVQCYGCGEHGDIFDVIRMEYGLDRGDHRAIFDKTYQVLGIDVEHLTETPVRLAPVKVITSTVDVNKAEETDYTDYYQQAESHIADTDYAKRRGLSTEVVQRFHLGFDPAWKNPTLKEEQRRRISTSPRLIIPTSPFSYVARDTRLELSEKQQSYAKLKVGHLRIFNAKALAQRSKPIFITEGEIDALSIESVGGCACALGSTSMVNSFLKEVAQQRPQLPLLIALDRDAAGHSAKDKLVKGLMAAGVLFACVNISGWHKDANEALIEEKEVFVTAVEKAEEMATELTENQPERENLVHDMNQSLRDMKKETLGLVEFWEKAIQLIKDTMLEMQEAVTACNILRVWSAGLQCAAKEFGMEDNPAVSDIRKEAEILLAGKHTDEDWVHIFDLINRVDNQTADLLQAMREKPHENQLLAIPSIREAEPLRGKPQADTPGKLYLAAVKRIVLEDDSIGRKAATARAVDLLERAHVKESVICQGLMASPRLQNRSEAERREVIEAWMNQRRAGRGSGR